MDGKEIVTGKAEFGIDIQREGMLYASIVHPPAFGLKFKSIDANSIQGMDGIVDVFPINAYNEETKKNGFDTNAFPEVVAVVGRSTWQVLQAKKSLAVQWEPITATTESIEAWGRVQEIHTPAGLENTTDHIETMNRLSAEKGEVVRRDGDPEAAFANAAQVIERTYSAPFLAHNCMEPMNFFAHVDGDKLEMSGPIQGPMVTEGTISADSVSRLRISISNSTGWVVASAGEPMVTT